MSTVGLGLRWPTSSTTGSGLPSRGVVYGPEGTGKTSLGCAAPRPVFLMTRGETGLETLIDAGRVPETAHFPEIESWPDLLAAVEALADRAARIQDPGHRHPQRCRAALPRARLPARLRRAVGPRRLHQLT